MLRAFVDSDTATDRPRYCIECGAVSTGCAAGWRAYIAFLEEDGQPPEVAIYCPTCAALELDE
jgi:hypothetical protein